eukprot:scaffold292474_cov30-Tisochrysis_lutea.AAC.1
MGVDILFSHPHKNTYAHRTTPARRTCYDLSEYFRCGRAPSLFSTTSPLLSLLSLSQLFFSQELGWEKESETRRDMRKTEKKRGG